MFVFFTTAFLKKIVKNGSKNTEQQIYFHLLPKSPVLKAICQNIQNIRHAQRCVSA